MTRPRVVIPEVFQDVSNYTNAMYAAGMEPVVVSLQSVQISHRPHREFMDIRDVRPETFDGLLIPGGADINPAFYGETDHGSHPADLRIDHLQFHLLEEFEASVKIVSVLYFITKSESLWTSLKSLVSQFTYFCILFIEIISEFLQLLWLWLNFTLYLEV